MAGMMLADDRPVAATITQSQRKNYELSVRHGTATAAARGKAAADLCWDRTSCQLATKQRRSCHDTQLLLELASAANRTDRNFATPDQQFATMLARIANVLI